MRTSLVQTTNRPSGRAKNSDLRSFRNPYSMACNVRGGGTGHRGRDMGRGTREEGTRGTGEGRTCYTIAVKITRSFQEAVENKGRPLETMPVIVALAEAYGSPLV